MSSDDGTRLPFKLIDHGRTVGIFKDEGCHLHPSCLSCPEPVCIYELPPSKGGAKRKTTPDQRLVIKRSKEPRHVLAKRFGISVRVVSRIKNELG